MTNVQAQLLPRKENDTQLLHQIQEIIDRTRDQSGALIRVLQQSQGLLGYLPPDMLKYISQELRVPLSEVYGIVSFYSFFSTVPKGKYVIQVCMGTSCYVKGGERILERLKKGWGLEPGGITSDGKYSLEMVRCLGACGLSPVVAISGDIHGKVKASKLEDILDLYK